MRWSFSVAMLAIFCTWQSVGAQTPMTSSGGMGSTSPLGTLGSSGTAASSIPSGSLEIDPGGLSPIANSGCGSQSGTTPMIGTSTFDGGGMTSASGCTSSSASAASSSAPISMANSSSLIGGAIPLGSTETDTTGLSPTIPLATQTATLTSGGITISRTGSTMMVAGAGSGASSSSASSQ